MPWGKNACLPTLVHAMMHTCHDAHTCWLIRQSVSSSAGCVLCSVVLERSADTHVLMCMQVLVPGTAVTQEAFAHAQPPAYQARATPLSQPQHAISQLAPGVCCMLRVCKHCAALVCNNGLSACIAAVSKQCMLEALLAIAPAMMPPAAGNS